MEIKKGDMVEITCKGASVHAGFKKWTDEVISVCGDQIEISRHFKDRVSDEVYRSQTMRISRQDGYEIKLVQEHETNKNSITS